MQKKSPHNLKTKREKKRYILFRINCNKALSAKEISDAINNAILSIFGNESLSKINPRLIEWDENSCFAILKCERSSKEKAIEALHHLREIRHGTVSIEIISVSGTLKALRKKAMLKMQNHNRQGT